MLSILSSELLKLRKTAVWFLVVLGPVGVVALQAVNFTLRYDYLIPLYADDLWGGLIENVRALTVPTLMIGLTIISSLAANIEHQTNAWKMNAALPVPKGYLFAAKFATICFLLLVSCVLLVLGTLTLGIALGFDAGDVPAAKLLESALYPYFASVTFVALQVWLSVTVKNQAVALTVGIMGTVFSLFGLLLPDWTPWKWPHLDNEWEQPAYSAAAGLGLGMLLFAAGAAHFVRKDVL
ncbi:ABC transporter permease [Paenibacillus thermotolerans]|uniref:ABC transporter permease n=1 Tax=Paenibacillus thermotolerans TaxID=3027807 RepID=UPI00236854E4|nr:MULTISPECIES: ABC transporter permease [unclassified Paenibacillus]